MMAKPWTDAELDLAFQLRSLGNSDAAIGEKIGRSESAVRWQLRYGSPRKGLGRVRFLGGELVLPVARLQRRVNR